MPWMETDTKKQRQHFYRDYASGQWSMSAVSARRNAELKKLVAERDLEIDVIKEVARKQW